MKNCYLRRLRTLPVIACALTVASAASAATAAQRPEGAGAVVRSLFPRTLNLGQHLPALEPLLAEDCVSTEVLRYTGDAAAPFKEQTQVNCEGLDLLGARRSVEFMFNDGPLGHVWIHIEPSESARIRQVLEEAFGPVVFETGLDQIFESGTVALRSSPAEVLVASPELLADITGYRTR